MLERPRAGSDERTLARATGPNRKSRKTIKDRQKTTDFTDQPLRENFTAILLL